MAIKINNSRISDKAWGDVDKTSLGNRLSEAYTAGEASKSVIREAYAYVPEDAFDDSGDEKKFMQSKAWGPHHELVGDELVVNRGGVQAAAAALAGARAEPSLSGEQRAEALRHIRKHYREMEDEIPDSLKEDSDDSEEPLVETKAAHKLVEESAGVVELLEGENGSPRRIKAIGITADVINGNNRRYPAAVLAAAVEELRTHLHETAGQGRAVQILGEAEHPSSKSGRPNILETVIKWEAVDFNGQNVLLEGTILPTTKGKDILALLEGGVNIPISQRGRGETRVVKENGKAVEEVTKLSITSYDVVIEASDPTAVILESQQEAVEELSQEEIMNVEELKKLILAHPELGITAKQLEEMTDKQILALENTLREKLNVGKEAQLSEALDVNLNAKVALDQLTQQVKVSMAIEEACKDLRYGKEINERFVNSIKASNPATPEAVKELVEARKKEYDALFATETLRKAGFKGIEVIGPVIEEDLEIPAFALPAFELTESMRKSELRERRNLAKPKTINEEFTKLYLEKFDQQNKRHLVNEMRQYEEAETTSDLNLPYSVSRAIIAEAFPNLVASGIFDFGLVDVSPFRLYYEAFAGETGYTGTITNEDVVSDEAAWVAMAHNRITPGSVVVEPNGGGTPYVEGSDYVIDYANGEFFTITAANGGTIGDSTTVDVDYTYTAIRKGESGVIERGKTSLSYVTVDAMADRLADQITREAVVFSRSQLGWDAVARTLANLVRQVRRKIDQGAIYMGLAGALKVASNSGGTWDNLDPISEFVEKIGVAKVKVINRYYEPSFLLLSVTNADKIANWDGFSAAGMRPDADLNANGYIGRLKGLPVFESTEMSDSYALVGNRELVMHRVFQAMQVLGPYPTYDVSGGTSKLVAADQYYVEEFNATEAPVPEKGAYVKLT